MSMLAERLELLKQNAAGACQDGVWNMSPYNHGFANGLRVAVALMTGAEAKYLRLGLDAPGGYKDRGDEPKARASKAVPDGNQLGQDSAPISPPVVGEHPASPGRGVAAVIPSDPVKKPEPMPTPPSAQAQETDMAAKKSKPVKKPVAKGAKAKPAAKVVGKVKAKSARKASIRKAASFKGAKRFGKGRTAKARAR